MAEVPAIHGGRVGRRPITAGVGSGQALLKGNPLEDRERPMDWVQLWMSIDPAVVPDVRPGEGARVGGKVPFLLLLQKLESGRLLPLNRSCKNTALSGRNAAVGLYFGRIGTVVGHQLVTVLHYAVLIM